MEDNNRRVTKEKGKVIRMAMLAMPKPSAYVIKKSNSEKFECRNDSKRTISTIKKSAAKFENNNLQKK